MYQGYMVNKSSVPQVQKTITNLTGARLEKSGIYSTLEKS